MHVLLLWTSASAFLVESGVHSLRMTLQSSSVAVAGEQMMFAAELPVYTPIRTRLDLQQETSLTQTASPQGNGSISTRFLAAVVGGAVAGLVVISILAIWIIIRVCKSNLKKTARLLSDRALEFSSSGSGVQDAEARGLSQFVQALATHRLDENKIIGRGSSSVVYEGLCPDGRRVAVKKRLPGKEHTARREHQILSSIHHDQIVKLVGMSREDSSTGRLLVFEFMANGSLNDQLHEGGGSKALRLGWERRLQIALQVSRAIRFLHVYAEPCNIIHGNVSSENVLLDEGWDAKLGGFGGAEEAVYWEGSGGASTGSGTDSNGINGGARGGIVTKGGDVHGFGEVLMELLTGRRWQKGGGVEAEIAAIDQRLSRNGAEIAALDERLPSRGAEQAAALRKALEIAAWCLQPHHGPTIVDVAAGLEQVLVMFHCHPCVNPPLRTTSSLEDLD